MKLPGTNGHAIEVLEEKVRHERELREKLEHSWNARYAEAKENALAQRAASSEALNLKAIEIDRRLENLNGEAGRLAKVLDASVPREVWEQSQKENDRWKVEVNKQLAIMQGKNQQTVYIVGVVIVIVQIALRFFGT